MEGGVGGTFGGCLGHMQGWAGGAFGAAGRIQNDQQSSLLPVSGLEDASGRCWLRNERGVPKAVTGFCGSAGGQRGEIPVCIESNGGLRANQVYAVLWAIVRVRQPSKMRF